MRPALKKVFDKAVAAATSFSSNYPVYATLIAIDILVLLLSWILKVLEFSELGSIEGRSPKLEPHLDSR